MKAVFVAANLEEFERALQELAGATTIRTRLSRVGQERALARECPDESSDILMALQVEYEPSVLAFEQLLELFWSYHDPQISAGAGGGRCRSVVVYFDDEQRIRAIMAKIRLERSGRFTRPIGTLILPAADVLAADEGSSSRRSSRPAPLYGAPPLRSSDHPASGESPGSP